MKTRINSRIIPYLSYLLAKCVKVPPIDKVL